MTKLAVVCSRKAFSKKIKAYRARALLIMRRRGFGRLVGWGFAGLKRRRVCLWCNWHFVAHLDVELTLGIQPGVTPTKQSVQLE